MNVVKKLLLGDFPSFLSTKDDDSDEVVVCDENENINTSRIGRRNRNKPVLVLPRESNIANDNVVVVSSLDQHQNQQHEQNRTTIIVPPDCGMMLELHDYDVVDVDDDDNDNDNDSCPSSSGIDESTKKKEQQQQNEQLFHRTCVRLHTAVPDKVYEQIHPHCHAPAYLQDVRLLHGGGSGTAVFHGIDDEDDNCNDQSTTTTTTTTGLVTTVMDTIRQKKRKTHLGDIVMKHGGAKDATEIFSLVTIRQELVTRVEFQQHVLKREAISAAERMRQKIPEFVMVYISPYHLRDRRQELWASLRSYATNNNAATSASFRSMKSSYSTASTSINYNNNNNNRDPFRSERSTRVSTRMSPMSLSKRMDSFAKKSIQDSERTSKRTIRLNVGKIPTDNDPNNVNTEQWESYPTTIDVVINSNVIPEEDDKEDNNNNNNDTTVENGVYILEDGLDGLQRFACTLRKEMADHQWKVTIAQKTIGGPNAENGAHVLTSGKLRRTAVMLNNDHSVPGDCDAATTATSSFVSSKQTTTTPPTTTSNPLLHRLVVDFCQIMEDLSILTYPNERNGSRVDAMVQEIRTLEETIKRVQDDEPSLTSSYDCCDYTDPNISISKDLDLYVGAAIHKNYDPIDGRFLKLREFAAEILSSPIQIVAVSEFDFNDDQLGFTTSLLLPSDVLGGRRLPTIISEGKIAPDSEEDEQQQQALTSSTPIPEGLGALQSYILTVNEEIPARFLATLLYNEEYDILVNDFSHPTIRTDRIGMKHVFVNPPSERSALDVMQERGWLELLQHATSFAYDDTISSSSRSAAMDCMWTCGLTDAGLHNLFVRQDRGVELFDLGEPRLEPQPAFLTKFLMSFFHTLGMEEDEDNIGSGLWVRRFNVVTTECGERLLDLTDQTKAMIPYIHGAFTYTLNYFVENIFYSNEQVRTLMLKYVVLQLLSDSSFCLARWQEKGGGTDRYGGKAKEPLEKWIWRSLWDQYIASYVYTKILLPYEQQYPFQLYDANKT